MVAMVNLIPAPRRFRGKQFMFISIEETEVDETDTGPVEEPITQLYQVIGNTYERGSH
jgi:hypothetical protein